ncbi:uromodulin-like [Sardina pilchardus]|uniref:uromodulin-like n=1 Tax=Sardina pilchardus TaxID=27697 RepID=UPI002E165F5B
MRTVAFLWIILARLPLGSTILASTHHATVNGNARGAPCVFPFDLWGTPHHGCSGAYHHSHWCSTTHTYEDDRLWGECPDYDVCDIHNVVDDPWRNVGFTSTFPSWPRTDDALAEGWYRFAGVGGDALFEGCPDSGAGGTKYPLSLCGGDAHPGLADGVRAMSLCSPDNCRGDEEVNVLACPEGFYLYYLYPTSKSFVTRHRSCNETVCGVNARCEDGSGACVCSPGYEIPAGTLPTGDSYGCADIHECARDSSLCGPNALCSNTNGSFSCVCNKGYQKPPGVTITDASKPCQGSFPLI